MATTIRPATRDDVSTILDFIRALARYEREPDAVIATEQDLLRDGFGEQPYYSCLIADEDGAPAGFAFYFFDYSTWLGRPGLYLEDIFVHPEFRGRGIGKALLAALIEKARAQGLHMMIGGVDSDNELSIALHKKFGFIETGRLPEAGRKFDRWLTLVFLQKQL